MRRFHLQLADANRSDKACAGGKAAYEDLTLKQLEDEKQNMRDKYFMAKGGASTDAPLGLHWSSAGPEKPEQGEEFANAALSKALARKRSKMVTFTPEEFDALGVEGLKPNSYVKARRLYFKPAGTFKATPSKKFDGDSEFDGDVAMGRCTAYCVWLCKSTECFKACVAREPETPLNELHLMQPVLALAVLVSLVVFVLVMLQMGGALDIGDALLQALTVVPQAVASALLLYVGWIAKDVPSHEELNIMLNRELHGLEASVEKEKANADDADKLKGLTLGWLSEKTAAREGMRQVHRDLNENQQTFWKFQLRSHLLRYLADGEEKNYKKEEFRIRNSDEWQTRDQLNALLENIQINGRLSLEELKEVAGKIKTIETTGKVRRGASGTFAFLGRIMDELVAKFDEGAIEAGSGDGFSYGEIVDKVYEMASSDKYIDELREVFSKDADERTESSSSVADSVPGRSPGRSS